MTGTNTLKEAQIKWLGFAWSALEESLLSTWPRKLLKVYQLTKAIFNEEKLIRLSDDAQMLTLNEMAEKIEKNPPRKTDNEALLIEAIGFLNHFMDKSD